jgi:hypothetical protein
MATKKTTKIARSAKTGQIVSKAEAKANPDTTVVETVAKKPGKFKLPKTMAECADLAYTLREERYAIQRQAKEVAEKEALLREHIIQNLPKSQASGVSGKVANAKVETDTVPTFTDKAKFLAYVKKTGDFDLMTTGMNASAVKARWENKKKVPGIGETQIVKLSLTKVK